MQSIADYSGKPGIYCIENTVNRKRYVGQAVDLERRIKGHLSAFSRGKCSESMQPDLDMHGKDAFCIYVLEVLAFDHKPLLDFYEYDWTQKLRPEYGGFHWNRPVTIRMKQTLEKHSSEIRHLKKASRRLSTELEECNAKLNALERKVEQIERWLSRSTGLDDRSECRQTSIAADCKVHGVAKPQKLAPSDHSPSCQQSESSHPER